ncbi:MAG: aminoacyl-tRNA hydrolase [Acutalibacteraceae bacterium]|nr:aminoacyl-tRNA hydrolase [Oscillospiraceae bacterium]MEE0442913.1 aminoacyl-tRNA hydrolase [Acutalibacteraceae bacterium]DAP41761.1 MAG TPA: peptidyl-tRNA hydrolase [Caudoviricetes sp.]
MFFKRSKGIAPGPIEFLIVGLGNPGKNYEFTRHNAGFLTLDHIASELDTEINNLKNNALVADVVINNHRCLLVKPQTFMNNSGTAVRDIAKFYKIPPEKIVVIFDDISLPCGKLRIRRKGTDGGHNGIKSIIYHLNSDQFPRIKIGVGAKPNPEYDLADWVLSKFGKDDTEQLKAAITKATEVLPFILDGEIDKAMNKAN